MFRVYLFIDRLEILERKFENIIYIEYTNITCNKFTNMLYNMIY